MKVLAVHPSSLMYSRIYLRLEPLGLELVAAAARTAGHDVRLIDLQSDTHDDYIRRARRLAARRRLLLRQLPRERSRDRRPGQGDAGAPPRHLRLRRRPQRIVHGARDPRARGGRHRLRAARRGRAGHGPAPRRGEARPRRRRQGARGHHAGRRRTRATVRPPPRRPHAGARSAAEPATLLHRPARSRRIHRVQPGLPMGLHVLQRLDLLRTQLSREEPRARRRGGEPRSASPDSSSWTTSRSSRPSTAWPSARPSRAAASRSATGSRRAPTSSCATRRSSSSGRASG